MALSKKQSAERAKVQDRLTGSSPVRLDVSSAQTGGERGQTLRVNEIHPSLESSTTRLAGLGVESGVITTPDGLSVEVTKGPRSKTYTPHGQGISEVRKGSTLPPVQEGMSQRLETDVRQSGKSAEDLRAEAAAVAAQRPVVASHDMVNAVMAAMGNSMGGNRRAPGAVSRVASSGPRGQRRAEEALGYSGDVQDRMKAVAEERIRTANANRPANVPELSDVEIKARAYAQVNEHLDEAIHGTKDLSHSEAVAREAVSHLGEGMGLVTSGTAGMGRAARRGSAMPSLIEMAAGSSEAANAPEVQHSEGTTPMRSRAERTQRGLGMSPSRSPELQAQHRALKQIVTTNNPPMPKGPNARARRQAALAAGAGPMTQGKWSIDASALDAARENDLKVLTLQQRARRAAGPSRSEMSTLSSGADIEGAQKRHEQAVFSTNNPGVGVPGPVARGAKRKPKILPPRPLKPGETNDIAVPPNLPSGPVDPTQIGRLREERRQAKAAMFAADVAAYAERQNRLPASKTQGGKTATRLSAPSNVEVAQTAAPSGVFDQAGLSAARKQNVRLGQREATGDRSRFKIVP